MEKKIKKEKKISIDLVIKILTGLIMIVFILFLFNKNSDEFEKITEIVNLKNTENTSLENVVEKTSENFNSEEKAENPETKDLEVVVASDKEDNKSIFDHRLIGPEEYKEKLESGEYIHIDIRTANEYNQEKIAGGLNIDYYATDFKVKLNELDKSKKYIYHCRSGSRSANSVPIFKELGFGEVLELEGGINNWKTKFNTL